MRRALLLTLSAALVTGCAQKSTVIAEAEQPAGIASRAIGLSYAEITAIPDPLLFHFVDSEPGDVPLPERPYYLSPPVITHTLESMVPITQAINECLECHAVEEKEPGEPTPVPASHYIDLRRTPETTQDEVVGSRYNCVVCHVAQTDAPPLVANLF